MSQEACSNIFKQSGLSFPLSSKKARIIHRCLAASLYLTCWFTHPFSGKVISGNDREIPSEYPYVFPVSGYMGHCEGQAVSINGRNERSRTINRCRLFCKFLLTVTLSRPPPASAVVTRAFAQAAASTDVDRSRAITSIPFATNNAVTKGTKLPKSGKLVPFIVY